MPRGARLCLFAVACAARGCAAYHFPGAQPNTARRAHIHMMMEDNKPPPEVIEAEAKAMPNRVYRQVGAGVGFGLSLASGVLSAAVLAGQPEPSTFVIWCSLTIQSCLWPLMLRLVVPAPGHGSKRSKRKRRTFKESGRRCSAVVLEARRVAPIAPNAEPRKS